MADPLFPQAVNDAMDGQTDTSSSGDQGALSQVSSAQDQVSSGQGSLAPASLFGGQNKYQEKLFDLLAKPPVDESAKWLGFAGAMGAPTKTGSFGESLSGGLSALARGKTEEEALKQKYREALIAQYSRLAMQQNSLNMIPGMGMPSGQPGGAAPSGAAGQPSAGGMLNAADTGGAGDQAVDPWDAKVPGYYGMTKRDVANYMNADPTGKTLLAAREKRATTSDRAGSIAMNLDPNTGEWVANKGAITAAALLKSIESQITSNNTEVRVPNSDGTETVMSRTKALHLHDDVSKLLGDNGTAPNGGTAGDVATVGPGVAAQLDKMPPGPDKDAIQASLKLTPAGQPGAAPGGSEPAPADTSSVVAGTSQSPAAKEASSAIGTYAGSIPKQINEEADNALQGQYGIAELQNLLKNFTPGRAAPLRQWMTEYASQLGVKLDPAALSSASSMEAFNKIAMSLATQASKQLSSRPSQLEFQKMLEANPNIQLLPEGLQKIIVYNQFKNNLSLRKQQEFYNWARGKNPSQYDQFLPHWNRVQMQNLSNPSFRTGLDTEQVQPAHAGVSNAPPTLPANVQSILDKYK